MQNYFTLFDLPASFTLNEPDLQKRYTDVQRMVHPDRLVGKSAAERAVAIERSMQANDAYETLKSPLTRAEYLLALRGVMVNSDADTVKPSPEVLMETMELREQLAEVADGPALKALTEDIKESMKRVVTELEGAFATANDARAAQLTIRLKYLGKTLEEAFARFYRMKNDV
jgi:molecular chaperone HscB